MAISVPAPDSDDDDRVTMYGKLTVTVTVVDGEDTGTVDLNAREPQVGRTVQATLVDADGGETGVKWQWYRGELVDGDDTDELQNECPAATYVTNPPVDFSDWQMIGNAKSPVYMPDSATFNDDDDDENAEVAYCLRADGDIHGRLRRQHRDGSWSVGGTGGDKRSCEHRSGVRG